MSAQEQELTQPFTPDVFGDREPFELPQANEDIKTNRLLFTAANHITPSVARDRPHMKDGGLNVYNPCLNLSRDFIRRGRIVPLLVNQHIPIPVEEANTENSAYFSIPLGEESLRTQGSSFIEGGMMGYPAYPGQQIVHILEGAPNVDGSGRRVGIVELTALKGHNYKLAVVEGFRTDPELWKIQRVIFPDYPKVPFQLAPFTELVKIAFDSNVGVIRDVAEDALTSCVQTESWMIWHMEQVHQAMAQAAAARYLHPYEEIDLVVLAQLGQDRQDEHYKRMAQEAKAQPTDIKSLVAEIRAGDQETYRDMMKELIREFRATEPVVKIDEKMMSAAPLAAKEPKTKPKS